MLQRGWLLQAPFDFYRKIQQSALPEKHWKKNELPVWCTVIKQALGWMWSLLRNGSKTFLFLKLKHSSTQKICRRRLYILLVDNCRSHRYIKMNEIEVHFFSRNVISLLQPMDQGIIQTVKLHYEINLVNAIIEAQNANARLIEFLKKIDLYKVILWIADAWEKIPSSTIYICWNYIWPKQTKDPSTQIDESSIGFFLGIFWIGLRKLKQVQYYFLHSIFFSTSHKLFSLCHYLVIKNV